MRTLFFERFFVFGHLILYLLQIVEKPVGRGGYQTQDEIGTCRHADRFAACARNEIRHDFVLIIADSHDDTLAGYDSNGHCHVGDTRVGSGNRYTYDRQRPRTVGLDARTLVRVSRIGQEVLGHPDLACKKLEIGAVRALHRNQAVGLPSLALHITFVTPEELSHKK